MTIKIVVPEASPSHNEFYHSHWRKAHSSKKKWANMILACLPMHRDGLKATGKRKVMIERHGKRPLDYGNLIGGLKGIVDNLVEFGLLVDDDCDHLDLQAVNVKLGKDEEPHTVFLIEDC